MASGAASAVVDSLQSSDRRASEMSTGSAASDDTGEVPDYIKHGATLFVDGDPNQPVLVKYVLFAGHHPSHPHTHSPAQPPPHSHAHTHTHTEYTNYTWP
jgi:hypothetical protein